MEHHRTNIHTHRKSWKRRRRRNKEEDEEEEDEEEEKQMRRRRMGGGFQPQSTFLERGKGDSPPPLFQPGNSSSHNISSWEMKVIIRPRAKALTNQIGSIHRHL